MLPIFKEYAEFLKLSIGIDIEEGFYWIDRMIIRAFDNTGKEHKLYRLYIDDELKMTYKKYNTKQQEFETWHDTIQHKENQINNLTTETEEIIKKYINKYKDYLPVVLTSGGKDSTVTMNLVKKVLLEVKAIFNNTSLDCADTYKHIKTLDNLTIINPTEGFYQWIKRTRMIPTRISRACCTIFKEGEFISHCDKNDKYLFFLGMRNDESTQRSGYQDEWRNEKWNNDSWQGILPIRKWTDFDIWLYILKNNLEFNDKYRKGYQRVGCAVACPFYTKSTWILDKYWYPSMYNRWHDILDKDFIENKKWTRLNCTLEEYHSCWNGGLVREKPNEEVVKEFADHMGLDIEIAKKYFSKNCCICDKKVKTKDDIAMNLKLLGRNIDKYYCKKHFIEFLGITKEKYEENIKDFKTSGCDLF